MKAIDVKYVFDQNLELKEIGTKTQYFKYLKTIFPESKVQDVLWHSTNKEIKGDVKTKSFDKDLRKELYGFYMSDVNFNLYGKNNLPVIINANKGKEVDALEITAFDKSGYEKLKDEGVDTVYAARTNNGEYSYSEIVSFDPKNIHILGSKKDKAGFKEFVENQSTQTLESKLLTSIFAIFTFSGLIFSASQLTGNIIGISNQNSNFSWTALFLIGLLGIFVIKKYKK